MFFRGSCIAKYKYVVKDMNLWHGLTLLAETNLFKLQTLDKYEELCYMLLDIYQKTINGNYKIRTKTSNSITSN